MPPSLRTIFNVFRKRLASPGDSSDDLYRSAVLAFKSPYLMNAVVDAVSIQPDDNILEIGLGLGDGTLAAYKKLQAGSGTLYTIDKWKYLFYSIKNRYDPKALIDKKIIFQEILDLRLLPYNNDFFDKIYHVHSQYFWMGDLPEVLAELRRVLKPGGTLLCGMQIKKLEAMEKLRMLQRKHYDPSRYLLALEPAGFDDLKMEYLRTEVGGDYQLISATKPLVTCEVRDPQQVSAELEALVMGDYNVERSMVDGRSLLGIKREIKMKELLNEDEKIYLDEDQKPSADSEVKAINGRNASSKDT